MSNFAVDVVEARAARSSGDRRAGARRRAPRVDLRGRWRRPRATLAAHLHELGVRRGDTVLTLVGNQPDWVAAMVACFRQGYVVLPCNEQLRAKDLRAAARRLPAGAGGLRRAQRDGAARRRLGRARRSGCPGAARPGPRATPPPPRRPRAARSLPDHVHERHRGRAEGRRPRPALPRRPARCRPSTGSRRSPATSSGAPPPAAGASPRATRSSHRGSAAPRRCCTTRASIPPSGWT